MNKTNRELKQAGSAHVVGAWLFLAAAVVAGILGAMRMMSPGATDRAMGGDCICLGALLAIIAAVLALLGIHRQNTVLYEAIGPSFQGSHGSGDDDSGGGD